MAKCSDSAIAFPGTIPETDASFFWKAKRQPISINIREVTLHRLKRR
jgi:hypothetical protein